MGFITNRINVVGTWLAERARHGVPELVGPIGTEVIFVLDGVGRFQMAPLIVRRVLRRQGSSIATILYDWQFGLVGEIWTDLMWYRRNRVMAAGLARRLLAVRREHPETKIHVVAYSGGVGIALYACAYLHRHVRINTTSEPRASALATPEPHASARANPESTASAHPTPEPRALACASRSERGCRNNEHDHAGGRTAIETLMLACPAVSPEFNLAPALRAVRRCYALVSPLDRWILGWGTRIFGTTDRSFSTAAGCVGFRIPPDLSGEEIDLYNRIRELRWSPELRELGHPGGHTGWASPAFLDRHLLPILSGEPLLPAHAVRPARERE